MRIDASGICVIEKIEIIAAIVLKLHLFGALGIRFEKVALNISSSSFVVNLNLTFQDGPSDHTDIPDLYLS